MKPKKDIPNPFPEVCPLPATFLETMGPLMFGSTDAGSPAPAIDLELLPPEITRRPPEWVCNVLRRIDETVLGEVFSWLKQPVSWRVVGKAVGSLNRFLKFIGQEVPKLLPGEEQLAQVSEERLAELDQKLSLEPMRGALAKRLGRDVDAKEDICAVVMESADRHLNWIRDLVDFLSRQAAKQPAEAEHEFYGGLLEGYEAVLDRKGNFARQTPRTSTYMELLVHWPAIEQLRQRQPPITRVELRAWLISQGVWASAPDQDAFNDLCDEIKLATKRRGAPRKQK